MKAATVFRLGNSALRGGGYPACRVRAIGLAVLRHSRL